MLWNASALKGYAVEASDGAIGTVTDLLFDDKTWTLRWLVVHTAWLFGRHVLLPLSALGQPDAETKRFPVRLTKAQVKDSPDVDTDLPVSRHIEAHVYNYYDANPYWTSGFSGMDNAIATPYVLPINRNDVGPRYENGTDALLDDGDPHLRSVNAVIGYHLQAMDGEIGHVEDFIVDDGDWRIRLVTVDTKNWLPGERVVMPPSAIGEIDWVGELIYVKESRDKVKSSPPYNPGMTEDGPFNDDFHRFAGVTLLSADDLDKLHIGR
jgi:hypothetical protein